MLLQIFTNQYTFFIKKVLEDIWFKYRCIMFPPGLHDAPIFNSKHMWKHWMSKTRPYRIRAGMRNRCYNTKHKQYKDYGGRWITICDRWLESFENFWEDMKGGYADNLQIDRIENSWNYEPWNCSWVTAKFNMSKRRKPTQINRATNRVRETWYRRPKITNKIYKWNLTELAHKHNINRYTLFERLEKWWSVEKAISTPVMKRKTNIKP